MKNILLLSLIMMAPAFDVGGQEATNRIERYHLGELAETLYLSADAAEPKPPLLNSATRAILARESSSVKVSTAEAQINRLVKNAQKLQLVSIIGSSESTLPNKLEGSLLHVPEYLHSNLRMLTQKSKHDLAQLRHALKVVVLDNP